MIIQDDLIRRINEHIKKVEAQPKNKNIKFECRQSKSSKSIYITLTSILDGEFLKHQYRISDHRRNKAETKIICKNTKFSFIENKINQLARKMRKTRYMKW